MLRSEFRGALEEWLSSLNPTHFVTLATNWDKRASGVEWSADARETRLRRRIHEWVARVERSRLGRNWQHRVERMTGVGMIEHLETNIHVHLMIVLDDVARTRTFEDCADVHWRRLVPSGDVDIGYDMTSKARVAFYLCKDTPRASALLDRLVLL